MGALGEIRTPDLQIRSQGSTISQRCQTFLSNSYRIDPLNIFIDRRSSRFREIPSWWRLTMKLAQRNVEALEKRAKPYVV
jgi:hypothetical protein